MRIILFLAVTGMLTKCVLGQAWQNWQGKEFLFVVNPLTYADAENDCIQKNAVLASVLTSNESAYVTSQINDFYWFGLTNTQTSLCSATCSGCPAQSTSGSCQNCYDCRMKWTWKDGRSMSFINWKDGQPNDGSKGGRCGKINGDGTWYDDICTIQLKYICKKDTTSATTTTRSTTTTTTTRPTTTTTSTTTTTTQPTTRLTTTTARPTTTTTTRPTTTTIPTTTTTTTKSTPTVSVTTTSQSSTTTAQSGGGTTTTTSTTNNPTTTKSSTVSTTTRSGEIITGNKDEKLISFWGAVGVGIAVLIVFGVCVGIIVCCVTLSNRKRSSTPTETYESGARDKHNPAYEDHDYSNDSTLNKDKNSLDKNTLLYTNVDETNRQDGHIEEEPMGEVNQGYVSEDINPDYTNVEQSGGNQYVNYVNEDEPDTTEADIETPFNEQQPNEDTDPDSVDPSTLYAQPEKKIRESSDTESGANIDDNNVDINSEDNQFQIPPAPPAPPMPPME